MKVRVVRPLCIAGKRKEVGEIVDLPTVDAIGAIHIGRAERVGDAPPARGPMTTETAEPLAPSPKKRRRAEEPTA
jgi:hypothetical protein